MAKGRYATSPPCCPCMETANQRVWNAPPASAQRFKYKYEPPDKIRMDDWEARTYWMDAYEKCIKKCAKGGFKPACKKCHRNPKKYISGDKLLPPGTLRAACSNKMKPTDKKGNLGVIVKDNFGKFVKDAKVKIWGPQRPPTKLTDADGEVLFSNLQPGYYKIKVTKKGYYDWTHGGEADVQPGPTIQVHVKLQWKVPGNLPVHVKDEDGNPVSGVVVKIDPREKEPKKTDKDGDVMFNSLPIGRYKVTGNKGINRTDIRWAKVDKPGVARRLELTLYYTKQMHIRIAKGSWGQLGEGVGIQFVSFHFDIRDPEEKLESRYHLWTFQKVITISLFPGSGGEAKKPGPWKTFNIPRRPKKVKIKGSQISSNDFAGLVEIYNSTFTIDLKLLFKFWVKGLETGPVDSELELPGIYWSNAALTELKLKRTRRYKAPYIPRR